MLKNNILHFLLFYTSISVYSQDTILLNRIAYPKNFNQEMISVLRQQGLERDDKIIAGNFKDKHSQFTIALYDVNRNGIYTDALIDEVCIGEYGTDSLYILSASFISSAKMNPDFNVTASVNEHLYSLRFSKNNFKKVEVKEIMKTGLLPDVKLFNKLPKIPFSLVSREKTDFKHYTNAKKLIYVEFWGMWCRSCLPMMDTLKEINQKYGNSLTIISLNFRDSIERVKQYIETKKYNWVQGISTELINREFLVNGFPHGVLFDDQGNLIKIIRPDELKRYLEARGKK